jgi:hypothetical protein
MVEAAAAVPWSPQYEPVVLSVSTLELHYSSQTSMHQCGLPVVDASRQHVQAKT